MSGLSRRAVAAVLIFGMIGSVAIAGLASLFASPAPDGLERVAQDHGIAAQEQSSAAADSPLADYGFTGVEGDGLSAGISLVAGLGSTLVLGAGLFWLVTNRRKSAEQQVVGGSDAIDISMLDVSELSVDAEDPDSENPSSDGFSGRDTSSDDSGPDRG
jgi:hypothetical protein